MPVPDVYIKNERCLEENAELRQDREAKYIKLRHNSVIF